MIDANELWERVDSRQSFGDGDKRRRCGVRLLERRHIDFYVCSLNEVLAVTELIPEFYKYRCVFAVMSYTSYNSYGSDKSTRLEYDWYKKTVSVDRKRCVYRKKAYLDCPEHIVSWFKVLDCIAPYDSTKSIPSSKFIPMAERKCRKDISAVKVEYREDFINMDRNGLSFPEILRRLNDVKVH